MTKEEILKSGNEHSVLDDINIYDGDLDNVYRAMDQYAEQEAMSFAQWIGQEVNPFLMQENGKWIQANGNATEFTTAELYQLFLSSIKS